MTERRRGRAENKPDIELCMGMPRRPFEMSNDAVVMLAFQNFHVAREEMMRREIMCVDGVDWDEANAIVAEMKESVSR